MKKAIMALTVMAVLAITVCAFAQDTTPQPVKQATLEELGWKQAYLQERLKTIQVEYKELQALLKTTQDELKARQPAAPKPQPSEPVAPKEPTEKKGKK